MSKIEMTDYEKIECAINKLRVFGSTTDVSELVKEEKGKNSLVLADSGSLKNYLYPLLKEIPNIGSMILEGYFVDISEGLYIKEPSDAITEIARRIEQIYIYDNYKGNLLPKEYMDIDFIYSLAEKDIKDYKYLRLLPILVRIKYKGAKGKTTLKICSYGQNLLPYVIDEKDENMNRNEINKAISDYIAEVNEINKLKEEE